MSFRTNDGKPAKFCDAFTQRNIGASACHVRRDRDRALLTSQRNNGSFSFMVLRIQDRVRNVRLIKHMRKFFRLLDRCRADQHWLPRRMTALYFSDDRFILTTFVLENDIRQILTLDRLVRRYLKDWQPINFNEFLLFRLRRTGHTCQLVIHTEIVLESDRR